VGKPGFPLRTKRSVWKFPPEKCPDKEYLPPHSDKKWIKRFQIKETNSKVMFK